MLTPLDIENQKFAKQTLNGYNVEEVDEFLDELTVDYAKMYKENTELRERIEDVNTNVDKYKGIETTLQETLVMAQSTADQVKEVARQQADQIIKDAQMTAKEAVSEINSQIILKEKELEDLKKDIDVYKAKMESLLISQLELLKEARGD